MTKAKRKNITTVEEAAEVYGRTTKIAHTFRLPRYPGLLANVCRENRTPGAMNSGVSLVVPLL